MYVRRLSFICNTKKSIRSKIHESWFVTEAMQTGALVYSAVFIMDPSLCWKGGTNDCRQHSLWKLVSWFYNSYTSMARTVRPVMCSRPLFALNTRADRYSHVKDQWDVEMNCSKKETMHASWCNRTNSFIESIASSPLSKSFWSKFSFSYHFSYHS